MDCTGTDNQTTIKRKYTKKTNSNLRETYTCEENQQNTEKRKSIGSSSLVRTAHMTVHNHSTQYSTEQF